MGIDCALTKAFDFTYAAELRPDLSEHEFDHVFVGVWDGTPRPDPDEVDAWGWYGADTIDAALREHAASFSVWFPMAWAGVKEVASELLTQFGSPTDRRKERSFTDLNQVGRPL